MKKKGMVYMVALALLLAAPVAMAQPVHGFGWLDWVGSAWSSVLEAVGVASASSTEEETTDPEPAPAPAPKDDGGTNTTECSTCGSGGGGGQQDGGPTLDPDG